MRDRRALARRLAALEAKRADCTMPFVLDDGRTVHVPVEAVLDALLGGAQIIHGTAEGAPYDGPHGRWLEQLAHAVRTPDDSLLAHSVVRMAREACRVRAARRRGDDA